MRNQKKEDRMFSLVLLYVLLDAWFGVWFFFAIPISRYQWIDEADEVKVEEEYCGL